ncbi:unnamed protein product, partial [Durusdinium trenchii]
AAAASGAKLWVRTFFGLSGIVECCCCKLPPSPSWLAGAGEWRNQRGVDGQLAAIVERQSVGDDFDSSVINLLDSREVEGEWEAEACRKEQPEEADGCVSVEVVSKQVVDGTDTLRTPSRYAYRDLRLAVPIMPDVFRGLGVPQPDEREATVDGVEQAL